MLEWLKENLGTLVVGLVVLAAVIAAAVYMISGRKRGRTSCGCGCGSCPMNGSCHKKQ